MRFLVTSLKHRKPGWFIRKPLEETNKIFSNSAVIEGEVSWWGNDQVWWIKVFLPFVLFSSLNISVITYQSAHTETSIPLSLLPTDENFILKHDRAFLLSMANRGKDTNGSQFFMWVTWSKWNQSAPFNDFLTDRALALFICFYFFIFFLCFLRSVPFFCLETVE